MGTSFRSYRVSYGFGGPGSLFTPALKNLIIITCAVFVGQEIAGMAGGAYALNWINLWFGLVPYAVVKGLRIWQPFTYMFLHAGLLHILLNMFVLWMFGRDLERTWGQKKFYTYYISTGVGAGLINVVVNLIGMQFGRSLSLVPTVGASGAIFGVLIANAILFPDRRVWMFPIPITMSMRVFVGIMAAIEFFSAMGAPGDNVSHVCHLGGLLVGYLYLRRGSFFYNMRNGVSDWKQRRNRRRFQVYMRRHEGEPTKPPDSDRWVN
jgi:membrane associated rhomboid family serine protease